MSDGFSGAPAVDGWLQPLAGGDGPCGPDLEYDNDFLSLTKAAEGKPETQFDAGVPPDWRSVRSQAEAIFERTRDLRAAILWLRACISLEGFGAMPDGLRLLHGLLRTFPDTLHPLPDPDDGDPYARMNAVTELREPSGLLGDLRRSVLFSARGVGDIRVRMVESLAGQFPPHDDDPALSRDQISQMLAAALPQQPGLRDLPSLALTQLDALIGTLGEQAGSEGPPDMKPLRSVLKALADLMPATPDSGGEAVGTAADGRPDGRSSATGAVAQGLSGGVNSRDEALRAIDMVCQFLERTEPTSPAPLLLRRARRMINRNFLQLMKELAPESLAEVARVMGVDPDTVLLDDAPG